MNSEIIRSMIISFNPLDLLEEGILIQSVLSSLVIYPGRHWAHLTVSSEFTGIEHA